MPLILFGLKGLGPLAYALDYLAGFRRKQKVQNWRGQFAHSFFIGAVFFGVGAKFGVRTIGAS